MSDREVFVSVSNLNKCFQKFNMPEPYRENKKIVDKKIANKNNETEDLENCQYSVMMKLYNNVKYFFSRRSTKQHGNELRNQTCKHAGQTAVDANAINGSKKVFSKGKNDQRPQIAVNGGHKSFGSNRYQDNEKSLGRVNREFTNLEYIGCSSAITSEESQITDNDKNNIEMKEDEFKTLKESEKRPDCSAERTEMNTNPHKDFFKEKDNKKLQIIVNGDGLNESFGINQYQGNAITLEKVSRTSKNLEFIDCASATKSEESQSKDDKNIAFKEYEFRVLKENKERSECATERNKVNILLKNLNFSASKCGFSNIQEIPNTASEDLHRRYSEPPTGASLIQPVQRNDDTDVTPKSTNIPIRSKEFSEGNLKSLRIQRLQSGIVIMLNDDDTNIKFTEFEPDVGKIVDETLTSMKVESNPNLMSGGVVVLEGFGDAFKVPNYYEVHPFIVHDISSKAQITKLEKLSSETLIFTKSFTGGNVTDCSSKGVSLPELFPLKPQTLHRKSVERHLSGGEMVISSKSENFVGVLSNIITIHETNSSNSDLDDAFINESMNSDDASESRSITTGESGADCSILPDANSQGNSSVLRCTFEPAISRNSECSSASSEKGTEDSTAYGL